MRRRLSISAALLAAFLWRSGRPLKNFMLPTEFLVEYYAHGNYSAQCKPVVDSATDNQMRFCEDGVFWEHQDAHGTVTRRDVVLSCDPNRKAWSPIVGPMRDPDSHGALWIYNPAVLEAKPQRLRLVSYPAGHDFKPLGLGTWPSENGAPSNLYVVNLARARPAIEQFVLSPSSPTQAKWVRTITHRWFVAPNSLALTSPTSFYLSNDHLLTYSRLPRPFNAVLPVVESVLGLPFAWLGHVTLGADGSVAEYTFSLRGIAFANGVALTPGGRTLALASSSLGMVYTYTRDATTNALTYAYGIPVPAAPDNLRYAADGTLVVAGHPDFPALTMVAEDRAAHAPSWVFAITERPKAEPTAPKGFDTRAPVSAAKKVPAVRSHDLQTLFQESGAGLSSSTTGLLDSATSKLFITGVFGDPGMMVCTPSP